MRLNLLANNNLRAKAPSAHGQPTIDYDKDALTSVLEHSRKVSLESFDAIAELDRIAKHISLKGIDDTLRKESGAELLSIGINLNGHHPGDVVAAIEGVMNDLKHGHIGDALIKILDAIADFINDIVDRNRLKSNEIRMLRAMKIRDNNSTDKEKFLSETVNALPQDVYMKITRWLGTFKYSTEVKTADKLDDAVSREFKSFISEFGYEIVGEEIVRRDGNTIALRQTHQLGWEIPDLSPASDAILTALANLRSAGTFTLSSLKKEMLSKADTITPKETDEIRHRLVHIHRVIVITERISFLLANQMIELLNAVAKK